MNIQDKRVVIGIDFDTADEGIDKTMARRVENCRINIVNNGKDGIIEPVLGNVEIPNALPVGDNKTIGSYSDTSKNKIYFFNWNSNNNDGIAVFDGTSFTQLVLGDLGWSSDLIIHSITLINNLLTWTEGGSKYPRQINVLEFLFNPIEFDLSLIKTPPTFPLQIQLQATGTVDANFYRKENYYFIYRFVYNNGQQSSWSPYSKLVSSKYTTLFLSDSIYSQFKINEFRVFREGGIDGLHYNSKIKYIDFAYAHSYLGPFKLFKRTKVDSVLVSTDWDTLILSDTDLSGYGSNEDLSVQFRNDLSFSVIAPTDTARPYDEIWPCEAIEMADNRNIIGNTLEGFAEFQLTIGNVSQGVKPIASFTESLISTGFLGFTSYPCAAELVGNFMVWKNNSKYGIGLVFYNEFGQKSGVYTDQRLKVLTPPNYRAGAKENLWSFNFDISGTPPDWATHYQVVRTDNNKVTRFVQGLTNDVLYVSGYDANGNPIVLQKQIGFIRSSPITTSVHIYPYPTPGLPYITVYRRSEVLRSGAGDSGGGEPKNAGIDEFGAYLGLPLFVRITYWTQQTNGDLISNIVYPKKRPKYNTFWAGYADTDVFPDYKNYTGGLFMEPMYEEDYVIGYIPKPSTWQPSFTVKGFSASNDGQVSGAGVLYSLGILGEPIYIGGVTRRGEKVDIYSKNGLDQAVDILIDIYNWNNNTAFEKNKFNSSNQVAKNSFNPSCETPYVFQKNDRLDIYYSANGTYVGILDLEIKDLVLGRYLKVKYDARLLSGDIVGPGAFIEVSTLNTGSDDIFFYEFGECYPISNAKTASRKYTKTSFSLFEGDTHYMMYAPLYATNTRVNFREPQTITFNAGQGYKQYPFFSMNPDNLNRAGIWEKANGRPNIVLLDGERQTRRKDTIRYSDRYIDGATINGTSTFYSFNSYQLDYTWGAIRKITSQDQILLINCEQEVALVYVNKAMLANADGSDNLIISDHLLNSKRKLPGGYGCVNPESVSHYNEYIYFWSKLKGCALRYNTFNSIFDISGNYKARSYFYNKISNRCTTGFDPKFRTQYFSFDDENIGFIDPASQDYPNTWSSFFSFLPDKFAYIQLQLYTFFQGKLFKHESGPVNTFYGVKYPSRIDVVFNAEPNMQKVANFISQESDTPLWCESITNQDGQNTTIVDGSFERINKDWQCDVPGDTSTGLSKWEGNLISSHLFNVTFRYDGASLFRLRYLNLYSQINKRTNK